MQEEKGTTEDEMAAWHHRLDGHEVGSTPGLVMDREARRAAIQIRSDQSLSDSWGRKESDTTERLI